LSKPITIIRRGSLLVSSDALVFRSIALFFADDFATGCPVATSSGVTISKEPFRIQFPHGTDAAGRSFGADAKIAVGMNVTAITRDITSDIML
jgi:hypothetical protein